MFKVKKRDGRIVNFEIGKIATAIEKAFNSVNKNYTLEILNLIALRASADFEKKINNDIVNIEDIQDSVEVALIEAGYADVAKSYILYRKQREKVRDAQNTLIDYKKVVDDYLKNQ